MLGLQDPAFFLYLACMKRTEKDKMDKKRLAFLREWNAGVMSSPSGVGKSNIGPCEITYLKEKEVDYEGCEYDRDKKECVCDSEYVDMIPKAKEELMKVLPELQKKSDEILEAFSAYRYSARVDTVHHPSYTKKHGVTPPKWECRVVWAGKEYVTEQKSSFKEAMTALNQLIETLQ